MPFPSAAMTGRGVFLEIGLGTNADPELDTYERFAELKSISGIWNETRQFDEVTNQDTPAGAQEFKPAINAIGQLSITCNFLPTHPTHDHLTGARKDQTDGTLRNWRVGYGPPYTTSGVVFSAYVASFPIDLPLDGPVEATITLQQSGPTIPVAIP